MENELQELLKLKADIVLKASKRYSVMIVKMPDGETYKASAVSPEIAVERCYEKAIHGIKAMTLKKSRRKTEHERQDIMEAMFESEESEDIL